MSNVATSAPRPRLLEWLEWCAVGEMVATALAWPSLAFAPRGDGHTVPGAMCPQVGAAGPMPGGRP